MTDPYLDAALQIAATVNNDVPISDPALGASILAQLVRPEDYAEPDVACRSESVEGPHGPVPVRVYGAGSDDAPVLVWCHGGGWLAGDMDMGEADGFAREVAARTDGVVVSVDYRLCLGLHYPVPLDDVAAAFRWAQQAWPGRSVSIGGASAGANLAAGLAVRLRDAEAPQPAAVVLAYPLVHPVLPALSDEIASSTASLSRLLAFAPEVLTPLVENYLGAPVADATHEAMAGLAPADGLPRTLIVNDEHDALRASGEAYAAHLREAGVDVSVSCEPGVIHGHLNQPWSTQSQSTFDKVADWLRRS